MTTDSDRPIVITASEFDSDDFYSDSDTSTQSLIKKTTDADLIDKDAARYLRLGAIYDHCPISDNKVILFTQEGVFIEMRKVTRKGEEIFEHVALSHLALRILSLMTAVEDGELYAQIETNPFEVDARIFYVPVNSFTETRKGSEALDEMSKIGFSFSSKIPVANLTLGFVIHQVCTYKKRKKMIDVLAIAKTAGWHSITEHNFSDQITKQVICENDDLGKFHLLPGRHLSLPNQRSVYHSAGNADMYKSFMSDLVEKNPGLGMFMGYAAGSFLRDLLGLTNSTILHLYDDAGSTSGKSLTLRCAASILGHTTKTPFHNWDTTKAGAENFLSSFRHSFCCLDEFQQLTGDASSVGDILIKIANNQSSLRSKQSGGLRDEINWDSSILSSGNISISDRCSTFAQLKALKTRVVEVNIHEHKVWNFDASSGGRSIALQIERFLDKNHGHLYDEIISEIKSNHDYYVQIFEETKRNFDALIPKTTDGDELLRRMNIISLANVGAILLCKLLKISDLPARNYIANIAGNELRDITVKQEESHSDLYVDLVGFFNSNVKHFIVDGNIDHNKLAVTHGVIGRLVIKDKVILKMFIKSDAQERFTSDAGRKFADRVKAIVDTANSLGVLVRDAQNKKTRKEAIGRCFVIDIQALRQHISDEEKEQIRFGY